MQWKIFFYNYMEISILTEISHVWVLSRFSGARLFVTLWTVTCQAPLSMGLSRQEYWSGSPCPPPGDLPDPGIEPSSLGLLHWQVGPSPLAPPIMCALMQKKKKKMSQNFVGWKLRHPPLPSLQTFKLWRIIVKSCSIHERERKTRSWMIQGGRKSY